jgi:hypothetical protein
MDESDVTSILRQLLAETTSISEAINTSLGRASRIRLVEARSLREACLVLGQQLKNM